jgi:hypothetical protein
MMPPPPANRIARPELPRANDPLAGPSRRSCLNRTELMDLRPLNDAVLDRVEQLGLVLFGHAFPAADDDGG